MKTLDTLFEAMLINHPATLDRQGQWSVNLPTFGGLAPADAQLVWSWDAERVIVGTSKDDLEIIRREDWSA